MPRDALGLLPGEYAGAVASKAEGRCRDGRARAPGESTAQAVASPGVTKPLS